MSKNLIFHVYFGTQGSAGLYLDEIYKSLEELNIKQSIFVSYYYPFNYGNKIFFKYTDLIRGKKKSSLRLSLRYIELIFGLFITFVQILKQRPVVVNYSLISSFLPEYLFLRSIKLFTKSKIIITCHDVYPFHNNFMNKTKEIKRRQMIFDFTDYLLVHNQNSVDDLNKYFTIDSFKILTHFFPIMDLNKICKNISKPTYPKCDFLFIGHLRAEKGINILLEAWEKFHSKYPDKYLSIAGNLPVGSAIDIHKYINMNVQFNIKYLTDEEYIQYILSSNCVILPYITGTNSGIVSTVLSLNKNVITSDIPMFKNNPLIKEDNMFNTNNIDSLVDLMENSLHRTYDTGLEIDKYKQDFKSQLFQVYTSVIAG